MVGIPQRQFAVLQGRAEVAQHRIEMVLGVPGHDGSRQGSHADAASDDHEQDRQRAIKVCCRDQATASGAGSLWEWVVMLGWGGTRLRTSDRCCRGWRRRWRSRGERGGGPHAAPPYRNVGSARRACGTCLDSHVTPPIHPSPVSSRATVLFTSFGGDDPAASATFSTTWQHGKTMAA